MEIWKDIHGLNGQYQCSDAGMIRRINKDPRVQKYKVLKMQTDRYGYVYAHLKRDYRKTVHRIVASTFISNPYSLPSINHKDGNKKNNCVNNLEWCTHSQNSKHASDKGLLSRMHCRIIDNNTGILYPSMKAASLIAGVDYKTFAYHMKRNKKFNNYSLYEKVYGCIS